MPEPTDKQRKTLTELRETYGSKYVKGHAADAKTGAMRVELTCDAGVWQWYYSPDGVLIDRHLTARLFEPEPPPHIPRNAIDN